MKTVIRKITSAHNFWNFSPPFLLVNFLIGTTVALFLCPSCFISWAGYQKIWDSHLLSVLISTSFSWGGNAVENYFDKRISWISQPGKRLFLQTITYLAFQFSVAYLLIATLVFRRVDFDWNRMPWSELVEETFFPMIVGILIVTVLISRSFLREWKKAAIEAEQLKAERYALQYQSLKDQLNPHFLFNSLNVLNELVYENPDTASTFIRKLSKIYRYVLEVQNEQLVPLKEEAGFAQNFLDLQKVRFGSSFDYRIDIPASVNSRLLPPLSLQLLLENTIKHNVVVQDRPLSVEILTDETGNSLIVRNNLQIKTSLADESTGIGLLNIQKRYELLSDRRIGIEKNEKYYTVILPLLIPADIQK